MNEYQNSGLAKEEEELNFKDLVAKVKEWIAFLKSKSLSIIILGFFGFSIGFIYASFQEPIYTASLSFALEDEKSSSGGLSGALGLASSLGIDLATGAGGAFSGTNLLELMKSRNVIEKVLLNKINKSGKTISIADYYLEFSGIRNKIKKDSNLSKINFIANENREKFSLQKDSLLGSIYEKFVGAQGTLSVTQKDKKISIFLVEVKTKDEFFSKVFVETLVNEVSDFYIETKIKKAKSNVAILQKQADSVRNELNLAISGVAQESDNIFNLNTALNIKRAPSTSRQIDVQANSAILTQLVTNLEMAKVTLLKETPLIQIIDKPILPLKKEKIGKLKAGLVVGIVFSMFIILFATVRMAIKKGMK